MNKDKCINKNCINYQSSAKKHEYCAACVRMGNEVMSNARCAETGNRPSFEQALRIGEHALRIYKNAYASPEQLEWATMIYPSGWIECFEPKVIEDSVPRVGTTSRSHSGS